MANYTTIHFKKNAIPTIDELTKSFEKAISQWDIVSIKYDNQAWELYIDDERQEVFYLSMNKIDYTPYRCYGLGYWLMNYVAEYIAENLNAYKISDEGISDTWKPKFHKLYPTYSSWKNNIRKQNILTAAINLFLPDEKYSKVFK